MSTAAAWDTLPISAPVRRPRLVVIDGGVIDGRVIDGGVEPASERTLARSVLSIPRWVRLAITLCVLAVSLSVVLGIGGTGAVSAPLGEVAVRPGQTLTEIARTQMPGVPSAEAVARIQLANNLPSSQVTAGQVLVIPGY